MSSEAKSEFWRSMEDLMPDKDDVRRVRRLRTITGVSQATVSRWKTGVKPIGRNNLRKISKAFRCDIHWLETHEGDRYIGRDDDPFIMSMSALSDDLTDDDRDDLLTNAEHKAVRNRGRQCDDNTT